MALSTVENREIETFAEEVYEAQKAEFVKGLASRIRKSIANGASQFESGQHSSLEDFKAKFIQEHGLDGKI